MNFKGLQSFIWFWVSYILLKQYFRDHKMEEKTVIELSK
jgi:hypothetical protein